MKIKFAFLVMLSLSIGLLSSCGHDRLDVDVSAVQVVPAKIIRFDRDLFSIDSAHIADGRAMMQKKYGDFWTIFEERITCPPDPMGAPSDCNYMLKAFLLDPDMRGSYEDVQKLGELTNVENQLTDAFKHFKYHFPKRPLPKTIYGAMTGHNFNFINTENAQAIGLEFYLGANSKYYEGMRRPMYQRMRNAPDYMAAGFVRGWMMSTFTYEPPQDDLLNRMIYEGKLLYLGKALLRETPDSILFGFTQQQIEWCESSEGSMWANLIEQKILYSESEEDILHLVGEAPFTPGFPRESPGRSGTWIGYRIVAAYMDRNEKVTLEELMNVQDGQLILSKSKYKPKL